MKLRESVTKDLWKTSINDLQSNIFWKTINECEETTAFILQKHRSVPLKMHMYFDKSMDGDLNYRVFCYIRFILS